MSKKCSYICKKKSCKNKNEEKNKNEKNMYLWKNKTFMYLESNVHTFSEDRKIKHK